MFRRITAFLLCLCLCAAPVLAAHKEAEPAPDRTLEIAADPRQQAIADYWTSLTPEASAVFSVEPSSRAPYAIGALDSAYLNDGLRLLNFYRWLAGLQPVSLSDHLNVQAQYGAVVLAANDTLTHSPKKPSGMSDSFSIIIFSFAALRFLKTLYQSEISISGISSSSRSPSAISISRHLSSFIFTLTTSSILLIV